LHVGIELLYLVAQLVQSKDEFHVPDEHMISVELVDPVVDEWSIEDREVVE
jgi:hypothetical protein